MLPALSHLGTEGHELRVWFLAFKSLGFYVTATLSNVCRYNCPQVRVDPTPRLDWSIGAWNNDLENSVRWEYIYILMKLVLAVHISRHSTSGNRRISELLPRLRLAMVKPLPATGAATAQNQNYRTWLQLRKFVDRECSKRKGGESGHAARGLWKTAAE
jgi:hypothetical protein